MIKFTISYIVGRDKVVLSEKGGIPENYAAISNIEGFKDESKPIRIKCHFSR